MGITRREVVMDVLEHRRPSYVPWHFGFTVEAKQKLQEHFGSKDIMEITGNHFLVLGEEIGYFEDIGNNRFRDIFGVTWDRTIDKDIGNMEDYPRKRFCLSELWTKSKKSVTDCLPWAGMEIIFLRLPMMWKGMFH
jgi:hypothetical protein